MKKRLLPLVFVIISIQSFAAFDDWFYNKTLRVDYYHTGNATSELYSIDRLLSESYWGGSHINLIDNMNYGQYVFKVFDKKTGELIYSRGYGSLYNEWSFTEEAKHTSRTFTETVVMPYPKSDVNVIFYSRNKKGEFEPKFEYPVEVKSYFISHENQGEYKVYDVKISGDAANKVDIVIIPEGYTAAEMDKFKADCDKFASQLFDFEPYKQNIDKFNIRAVLAPSVESGTDIPADNVWKQTILNSNFYTFDSERYLMTTDNKSVRDVAGHAPYDQIYILANTDKYGGGAIFNFYNLSVNSNSFSAKIFVHEFGHGFAGLADEYDDGSTSYNDMYPQNVEPWEPNITSLVNFDSKWKAMLEKNCPIPTPLNLKCKPSVGVYEGAGYVAKGLYRPLPDCLMRSFKGDKFCPVCTKAIQKMIDFYAQ